MGKHVLPGIVLAVVVGCSGRSGVADADDPKTVIEKAIKAQGGEDKLAQFKAGRWKGQGTLTLKGQNLPLTLETVYQLPDKYKTVMHIEVHFDKDSVLPVKTVRPSIDAETLKEITIEVIYSAIKEFDGIKWPTKMVVNQDGKKLMEVDITEFKKLDKLDSNEFARPK